MARPGAALPVLVGLLGFSGIVSAQTPAPDWRSDWGVADGFSLRRDTEGYQFPTAIAVVPDPGPDPGDPRYFITELQGTIKVVTNDRAVHVFAHVPAPVDDTLPKAEAEVGLAGICLEPRHGYVFATYAYHDAAGVLRNAIVRYRTPPGRFGVRPSDSLVVRDLFARDVAAVSHQIGPCQATERFLFVSVGDGENPRMSRTLGSTLGKILRLDLDGRPAGGNPFADRAGASRAVWALGLRNPFGLKRVGERLFAADNGNQMDRFVEIERGRDYLYDGTDRSIGAAAAQVFSPPPSPVQLDYCTGAGFPAPWRDRFYLALAGRPVDTGADAKRHGKGVMVLDYGMAAHRMRAVPRYLLRYQGTHPQSVVGVGCAPDRLYVVPLYPDMTGRTPVLVARYDPASAHPYPLADEADPVALMEERGCFGCHTLGGRGGTAAPPLDYPLLVPRLRERLATSTYAARVRSVDSLEAEPFASFRGARARVLQALGDDRLRLWLRYHVLEPRFDNPESQMPNLGLSDAQAVLLAGYLLTPPPSSATPKRPPLLRRLSPRRRLQLATAFGLTFAAGIAVGLLAAWLLRRRPGAPARTEGSPPG
jgi:mono/diheme cytochrome c family protein